MKLKENMPMALQILDMTKKANEEDSDSLKDFAGFCAKASDAQLPNIYKKEKDAGREEYADIAQAEMSKRGLGEGLSESTADEVEALVDKSKLSKVLEELVGICFEKAEHIRTNAQDAHDEPIAKSWEKAGKAIDTACSAVKGQGL